MGTKKFIWTNDRLLILKERYQIERNLKDLALTLGCSINTLYDKGPKEGLKRDKKEERNSNWNGGNSYFSIHDYVRQHKPKPEFCECCKKIPPNDIANISGEYKRDIEDFEWLCRRCHMKKDGRLEKFKKNLVGKKLSQEWKDNIQKGMNKNRKKKLISN